MKDKKDKKATSEGDVLSGWPAIAKYLGQPVAVAQRWAKDGMPVQKMGRNMTAVAADLSRWLGRESGSRVPVHIAQPGEDDLLKNLRLGLKEARGQRRK